MFNYLIKKNKSKPQNRDGYNRTRLSATSRTNETRVLQTHTSCSRRASRRRSNVDGGSRTQAEGRVGGDVLLTDLVAVQPQRLQSGEVGDVREGAEASQSELCGGGGG